MVHRPPETYAEDSPSHTSVPGLQRSAESNARITDRGDRRAEPHRKRRHTTGVSDWSPSTGQPLCNQARSGDTDVRTTMKYMDDRSTALRRALPVGGVLSVDADAVADVPNVGVG